MARLRWPGNSIHAQVESVFRAITAIGMSKKEAPKGHIRSIGTLRVYKAAAHSFAKFLQSKGVQNLQQTDKVELAAKEYLSMKLNQARQGGQSVRTQEACASALSALARGFNAFFSSRNIDLRLNFSASRKEFLELSRAFLPAKSEYKGGSRAYPRPAQLVAAISDEKHALQASLQYQSGMRAEGVGAPSGTIRNPMTKENLRGYAHDPITGTQVGIVEVKEKGGKWTQHFMPRETYERLASYLEKHGSLESKYSEYRGAVLAAAKATGQYDKGRATHGLKTYFAQARYMQCVRHGFTHERALQATALELAHNRMDVTMVYLKG